MGSSPDERGLAKKGVVTLKRTGSIRNGDRLRGMLLAIGPKLDFQMGDRLKTLTCLRLKRDRRN